MKVSEILNETVRILVLSKTPITEENLIKFSLGEDETINSKIKTVVPKLFKRLKEEKLI